MREKERIRAIFEVLRAQNPSPTTELLFGNGFQLLVAVVLSAQATDKGVNKATRALFDIVWTPQDMLDLGLEKLVGFVKTVGLYPTKTKNILALSEILVREYGGEVPHSREALEKLPGVGRKTANVVLNTLWGEPVMAVDTHVHRISNRLGLSSGATPRAVEDDLMRIIPLEFLQNAHHWLILLGRYTCVARGPKCGECPVREFCPSVQ